MVAREYALESVEGYGWVGKEAEPISPRFRQPLHLALKYIPLSTLHYLHRTFSLVEFSPYNSLNRPSLASTDV
jgi:hypothetical protein